MLMHSVLVVGLETHSKKRIAKDLIQAGLAVYEASSVNAAVQYTMKYPLDMFIIDAMLPAQTTIELCKELRNISYVPILLISRLYDDPFIIDCFAAGADDIIIEPYRPQQLIARIHAHFRRASLYQTNLSNRYFIAHSGFTLDLNEHTVHIDERTIQLSSKEFELLQYLASSPNTVFRSEQLFERIWNSDSFGDTRTLMVHISNLRKKIEPNPAKPVYIITIRGVGYKFLA